MSETTEVQHTPIARAEWRWFGNAGHLIVSRWCRFHLCTQVGPWLVSTVGEYWPERPTREIHAQVHDPRWFAENRHRRGDDFDAAYMRRFGYEEIGYGRTFETMVFRAGAPCTCGCGLPEHDGGCLDSGEYNDAVSATAGHMEMCERYAAIARAEGRATPAPQGATQEGEGEPTVARCESHPDRIAAGLSIDEVPLCAECGEGLERTARTAAGATQEGEG